MARLISALGCFGLLTASWLMPAVAFAQGEEPSGDESSAEPGAKSDEPAPAGATAEPTADAASDNSPVEESGKTYRSVGLRYRGIIVPKFIENLFADGGRTVYVNAFGPEFNIRKDNFEFGLSPWLAFYSMGDTGFKGSSDPATSWEIISSQIKVLYLTSDFVWTHPISPEFGINYGFGAGLGIVFGDLHRNQSYPNGATDPNNYTKCPGPVVAGDVGNYCGQPSNNHYGNYTEPSWVNGGSKPNVFPWLAAQTGLRYKPAKNFIARLDLGFGLSGFFFGLGADYGL